jgi:hypothetical protein
MLIYREFDAGPDPFGRKYHVLFKWLQTAISLRHADTVDVKFILQPEDGGSMEKTVALPHALLTGVARENGRELDDAFSARLAMLHLKEQIETGEDIEKELVTVLPADLRRHTDELIRMEKAELQAR